jgi:hypothetical protein
MRQQQRLQWVHCRALLLQQLGRVVVAVRGRWAYLQQVLRSLLAASCRCGCSPMHQPLAHLVLQQQQQQQEWVLLGCRCLVVPAGLQQQQQQ